LNYIILLYSLPNIDNVEYDSLILVSVLHSKVEPESKNVSIKKSVVQLYHQKQIPCTTYVRGTVNKGSNFYN
jgi:hypothetical protein